jgi:hypothetical protein
MPQAASAARLLAATSGEGGVKAFKKIPQGRFRGLRFEK